MVQSRELAARFEAYSDWRRRLSAGISGLHEWLSQQELADAQADLKIQHLLERLHQDKLVIAFVAEFSRGKSELINAIFFADFGQRLLPSSAGRTTMCPTELLYDPTRPPSIRLLPIETRAKDGSVAEFKNYADEWVTLALDLSSADKMSQVLSQVSQTKRVPVALARKYGLHDDGGDVLATARLDHQLDLHVLRGPECRSITHEPPCLGRRIDADEMVLPDVDVGARYPGIRGEDKENRMRVGQQVERELGFRADGVQPRRIENDQPLLQ